MNKLLSDKQKNLLKLWQTGALCRINILDGAVRSGKTWISLVLWAFWVAGMPRNSRFLMAGKTLSTLRRNCLDPLSALVGEKNFVYSESKKEALLFGRLVYLEGAGDSRSESKIRGLTLAGAYCDELSLFPEDFFAMLLSRLSVSGAKLFATTNPDSPNHWLMKNYLDRKSELDILTMSFSIDDNPFLDSSYVDSLKKEYAGVFYERFILGRWVVAEGLVYPMFDPKKHVVSFVSPSDDGIYYISVDYGTANPFSMGLWRIDGGRAVRIREYYHDSRLAHAQKTDEEYYLELENLAKTLPIQAVIIDPSAASFIETIRRHGRFSVRHADNSVADGIRTVASMLSSGRLLFDKSCKDTIREFGLYSWDTSANEDRPIKENDHAMDDVRYFCSTVLRREARWEEAYDF